MDKYNTITDLYNIEHAQYHVVTKNEVAKLNENYGMMGSGDFRDGFLFALNLVGIGFDKIDGVVKLVPKKNREAAVLTGFISAYRDHLVSIRDKNEMKLRDQERGFGKMILSDIQNLKIANNSITALISLIDEFISSHGFIYSGCLNPS